MRISILGLAITLAFSCSVPESNPPQELMDVPYLVFSPETKNELVSPVTLNGQSRRALIASTPAEFRYRVRLPERAFLTFSVGISQLKRQLEEEEIPAGRLTFSVSAGEHVANELLLKRDINIARRDQWIEQQVDLRSFSGKEIWLVFEASFGSSVSKTPRSIVGVIGEPIIHDRAHYSKGRGVVLISIDTLRRDHVSVYGYPRQTTPGLKALAEEAVVFEDAVSTSSWTLPAHASLFTSTYPSIHGAVNMDVGLATSWPSLPSIFQESGFTTQAFVTHLYLSGEYGFKKGFDRHEYLEETRAEELTDRAINFLTAHGDKNFFLFVHYYDPHWHYDPPAPFNTVFDALYDGDVTGVWWDFKDLDADSITSRDRHHIEALYDGEILYTDRQIERLLRKMKQLDMFDNSLIVVTSDHGEEFLDHGAWEHQKTLYEEQLRIPLIIKYPESEDGGQRVYEQVSLIDVAPTLVRAMGISTPSSFQGRDLRGALEERSESWASTEHTIDGSRKIAVRRGINSSKAIFSIKDEHISTEVYDLENDPRELNSVVDETLYLELENRLIKFITAAQITNSSRKTSPAVKLEPKELNKLRALGYIR